MGQRMEAGARRSAARASEQRELEVLADELVVLRESMTEFEARLAPLLGKLDPAAAASARNLGHLLAMQGFDLRQLQVRLKRVGLSSLDDEGSQVLAGVDKVLGILGRLCGRPVALRAGSPCHSLAEGLIERRAETLFGEPPATRRTRIMVTLPSAAARDDTLVEGLVRGGMDVARIDCAHDTPSDWEAMAARVRRAAGAAGRSVKVLMDLAGPGLRTGPIEAGPAVLKLRPQRDALGTVALPIRLGLRPFGSQAIVPGADAHVGVDPSWLAALDVAAQIDLVDARARTRRFAVLAKSEAGALVEGLRTVYLTPETRLRWARRDHVPHETPIGDLPVTEGRLHLRRGETLRLVRQGLGHSASDGSACERMAMATIACKPPEALDRLRKGDRVWLDEGRIGGVVRRTTAKAVEVEITDAADEGSNLAARRHIELPDTRLDVPALTTKDIEDLAVVARQADLVAVSCVDGAADLKMLRRHLRRHGAGDLGVILKIDTPRAIRRLPELLFAVMGSKAAGVMIARGDLEVEPGSGRGVEAHADIRRACVAAQVPVVWVPQAPQWLAKTGLRLRAAITDAATAAGVDCVALDRGSHVPEALHALDEILCRLATEPAMKGPSRRTLNTANGLNGGSSLSRLPDATGSFAQVRDPHIALNAGCLVGTRDFTIKH